MHDLAMTNMVDLPPTFPLLFPQVDLHFRTLDFGQVTVGSSNVRNLAVTNNLPQAVLAALVGLEGQSELAGTGPPAQVVPAGATAGFDVHFKCHTEQVHSLTYNNCPEN